MTYDKIKGQYQALLCGRKKSSCRNPLVFLLPHYLLNYLPSPKNVVSFRINIFTYVLLSRMSFRILDTWWNPINYSRRSSYSTIPRVLSWLSPSQQAPPRIIFISAPIVQCTCHILFLYICFLYRTMSSLKKVTNPVCDYISQTIQMMPATY